MNKGISLVRRGGIYYFRARIPAAIARKTGKKEIRRSLGTGSLTEARRRARPLAAIIAQLRAMSDLDIFLRHLRDAGISADNHTDYTIDRLKIGNVEIEGLHVDPDKPGDAEAAADAIRAAVESQPAAAPLIESKTTTPAPSSIMLSDAIARYIDHYATTGKPEMLGRIIVVVQTLFVELIGDKPINALTKRDLIAFFDDVQNLPRNWQSSHKKGYSIREIITGNAGLEGLSENTIRTPYKAALNGFLEWSHSQLSDFGFPDLKISKHDITYRGSKQKGDGGQRAFELDELKQLFEGPEMHSFASRKSDLHKYWLAHLGLFSGARIRELCQLNPLTDYKIIGGVHCLHINEDPDPLPDPKVIKSLKNKNSKRQLPIHPQLIKLGFLDYIEHLRNDGARRLFPAFPVSSGGDAGAKAGDFFRLQLRQIDLRDETPGSQLTGFHAFRHTFITHAHNHDIGNYWEITGHDDDNVPDSAKIYRGPKDAPKLQKIIEQISFDIDFIEPIKC